MLRVAKKYKTNLAAIRLTPQLKAQLPAWYHIAAEYKPMQGTATKCLISKHKATTIADLLRTSNRIRNAVTEQHRPSPYCCCQDCIMDRQMHCLNPHACALEASARLDKITPKLNPLSRLPPHNNLSLTATRKARNEIAKRRDENITFDPSVTSKTDLAECFRIFTNPEKISNLPATRNIAPPQVRDLPIIMVYTDRACFNNRKQNAICGSRVWFGPDDQRNTALKVPGRGQSN